MFSLDDTLEVLADEQRRKIMYVLDDRDKQIAAYDEIIDGLDDLDYLFEKERDRFKVAMAHNHLPKMADYGLIEHDNVSQTVRYVQDEEIEEILEFLRKYED